MEDECDVCHGDGMDPYTDHLLPCPQCDGSGTYESADNQDWEDE